MVEEGTVSYWNADRGFGFIVPDDGASDCFVHIRQIEGSVALEVGQRVEFVAADTPKGRNARAVRVLAGAR